MPLRPQWKPRISKPLTGANPRPRDDEPTVEAKLPPPTGYQHKSGNVLGIPKPKPARDASHLAFIRSMPCAWCTKPPPSEASHHGPHGVASKTDDYRALPLCTYCHRLYHATMRLGQMTPEDTRAWVAEQIIRTLIRRLEALREEGTR